MNSEFFLSRRIAASGYQRSIVSQSVAPLAVLLLMALETAAVFMNGAYFIGPMTLCVIGAWLLLIGMVLASSNDGILLQKASFSLSTFFLGAFWFWTGFSVFWSFAADLSWTEFNRTGGYLAIFLIGTIASRRRITRSMAVWLFLAAASAGALYSIGVKALPTVVDNLENVTRVSVPLGSVNGLGLLAAFTFPLALYLSSSKTYYWLLRLFAILTAPLLLICLFYTLSRGATLAIAIGLIVYFSIIPLRLRSFGSFMLALVPTIAIAWWSSGEQALSDDRIELAQRAAAAASLRIYLIIAFISVGLVFMMALLIGRRVTFPRPLVRATGAIVLVGVMAAIVTGASLFVSSKSSFGQWLADSYHEFTLPGSSKGDVNRLMELGRSGDRWQLWQEALSNWESHPITGTGAQTFPVIHLTLRTRSDLFVKQPHGLAFRVLTELGVIGFLLAGAFISLTMYFGSLNLSRTRNRWDRGMMAAILSMIIIYLIHTSYDWDWNMFALTLPYFLFTGILVAWQPVDTEKQKTRTKQR